MNKRIYILFTFLAVTVLLMPHSGNAADFAKVGTVGTQFLKIPVGARGVGMGNAFSALSDDGTAMFWNPAGLIHIQGTTVSLENVQWLADIQYNAVAVAHNLNPSWSLGFFVTSLNSGEIERTTVERPEGTDSYFSVTDVMVGATAATQLTNKFSFGANIKYVRENLDDEIAAAWAVDVGTMYDTRWKTIKLSMNIRNFGPEMQLAGNFHDFNNGVRLDNPTEFLPYHFPMTFKMGFTAEPYKTEMHRLTIVGDLEHPNDNVERYNLGSEYAYQEMFFLRAGYTFRHDLLGLSTGMGAKWKGFGIDYAYSDFGILEMVQRFNISFTF